MLARVLPSSSVISSARPRSTDPALITSADPSGPSANTAFNAGWYTASNESESPEILDVALDRASYKPGETAKLRIATKHGGKALISVLSNGLLSQQEPLIRELKRMAKAGVGSAMTRIHGDFHLGQVLVASGDVYLIDFEGEPGRPLAERRAKTSPLRDVAGLMRSLDYAAAATLDPKKLTAARLPAEQREAFITALRDGAQRAFLDAYVAASGTATEGDLLSFFLIEKAAYELAYEAANRPSWLLIPVNGLARLAARIQRTTRSEP